MTPSEHTGAAENAKTTSEGGSANSSLNYGNVMQSNSSIIRKVHILACALLGLDDSDHEDDEEAKPLEDAIMRLATEYAAAVANEVIGEDRTVDLPQTEDNVSAYRLAAIENNLKRNGGRQSWRVLRNLYKQATTP
jgi:hypothetical protein